VNLRREAPFTFSEPFQVNERSDEKLEEEGEKHEQDTAGVEQQGIGQADESQDDGADGHSSTKTEGAQSRDRGSREQKRKLRPGESDANRSLGENSSFSEDFCKLRCQLITMMVGDSRNQSAVQETFENYRGVRPRRRRSGGERRRREYGREGGRIQFVSACERGGKGNCRDSRCCYKGIFYVEKFLGSSTFVYNLENLQEQAEKQPIIEENKSGEDATENDNLDLEERK
jgi:hypothetical protein